MARALVIEEESGTCSGFVHPHNGYYAGDFNRVETVTARTALVARFPEQASPDATVLQMVTGVARVGARTHARAA